MCQYLRDRLSLQITDEERHHIGLNSRATLLSSFDRLSDSEYIARGAISGPPANHRPSKRAVKSDSSKTTRLGFLFILLGFSYFFYVFSIFLLSYISYCIVYVICEFKISARLLKFVCETLY